MKKKDLYLLLVAFGILIAFCSYQFIFLPYQDKADALAAENDTLQATVTELENLEAQRETFLSETERMKAECTNYTNSFPSGLLTEDEIMYIYNMEAVVSNDIAVPSMSMGEATQIAYTGNTVVGEYQLVDEGINMYTAQVNTSYTTSYMGLKNTIKYIYSIPGRKSINNISMGASGDGLLTGSVAIDFYYLTGTEIPYAEQKIPGVGIGTPNIFGMLERTNTEVTDTEVAGENN